MRLLSVLLSLGLLIIALSCSAGGGDQYLTPIPEATLSAYKFGAPVQTRLDAAIAGRKLLLPLRVKPIGTPQIVPEERLTLEAAYRRIGHTEAQYAGRPKDLPVWLVIFEGQWQLIPPDPGHAATLPAPYHGCVYSLFAAGDGEMISGGDVACPAKP